VDLINLNSTNLIGTIPAEIGNLSQLRSLYLIGNQLTGEIPVSLVGLSSLQVLSIHRNQLTGSIPSSLGGLTSLTYLGLAVNQLSGSIPAELGNLSSLQELYLDHNQLSGSIPASIGNLTGLTRLYINDNPSLAGPLPLELQNLTGISIFYFHNTDLCEPQVSTFQTWLTAIPDLLGTNVPCPCYLLTLTHTGSGTVPVPSPASSGACGLGEYPEGELITLTAFPDPGYEVGYWTGTNDDASKSTVNTLTMPSSTHAVSVGYESYCAVQTSIPQIECEALVTLYNSTAGSGWTNNTGWATDPNP
jgi:hypothetical protein